MRTMPAVRAARGGLAGRRVQALVIGLVVLISTAASALALGLLVDANAPFDQGFAAQHGAHLVATVDSARATAAQLARVPGVTAESGPYPEATVTGQASFKGAPGVFRLPPVTLAGRSSPGGVVDDIHIDSGRWARRPGEVVVSRDMAGPPLQLGQQVTGTGGGPPTLGGVPAAIPHTARGRGVPPAVAPPLPPGTPPGSPRRYRFPPARSRAALH